MQTDKEQQATPNDMTYASMFLIAPNSQNSTFIANAYNGILFDKTKLTAASLTNGATQN